MNPVFTPHTIWIGNPFQKLEGKPAKRAKRTPAPKPETLEQKFARICERERRKEAK